MFIQIPEAMTQFEQHKKEWRAVYDRQEKTIAYLQKQLSTATAQAEHWKKVSADCADVIAEREKRIETVTAERNKLQRELHEQKTFHTEPLQIENKELTAEVERLKKKLKWLMLNNGVVNNHEGLFENDKAELRNKVIEECKLFIFKRTLGMGHDVAQGLSDDLEKLKVL